MSHFSEMTRWVRGDLSSLFTRATSSERFDRPVETSSTQPSPDEVVAVLAEVDAAIQEAQGLRALALLAHLHGSTSDQAAHRASAPLVARLLDSNVPLGLFGGGADLRDLGISDADSFFTAIAMDEVRVIAAPRSIKDLSQSRWPIAWDRRPWDEGCPHGNLLVWTVLRSPARDAWRRTDRPLRLELRTDPSSELCHAELGYIGPTGFGLIVREPIRELRFWQTDGRVVYLAVPQADGLFAPCEARVSWCRLDGDAPSAHLRMGVEFTEPYDELLRGIERRLLAGDGDYLCLMDSLREVLEARREAPGTWIPVAGGQA